MSMDDFDRLEEGLGRLLLGFETMQTDNLELRDAVEAKDIEVQALRKKVAKLEEERDLIKKKVDTLLTKLDGLIQGA